MTPDPTIPPDPPLSEEDRSKDRFFEKVAVLAQEMIDAHGKDFTMGTLVLAARFIADGKPIGRPGKPPG